MSNRERFYGYTELALLAQMQEKGRQTSRTGYASCVGGTVRLDQNAFCAGERPPGSQMFGERWTSL